MISREAFVSEVLSGLRERGATDFVFDEKTFSIRATTTDADTVHFLGFLYGEIEAAATDRDRKLVVERAVANTLATRGSLDRQKDEIARALGRPPVLESLMPVLAARRQYAIDVPAQMAEVRRLGRSGARPAADDLDDDVEDDDFDDDLDDDSDAKVEHLVVGEHLAVALAIDHDARIEYVPDPSELGLAFDDALARALANLRRTRTSPLRAIAPSLYGSLGDDYESARMLLTDELRALSLRGDPVVMVPWRGAIFVAGSRDAVAIGVMTKLASEPPKGARLLSTMAFRLDTSDRLEPFDDDGGNALLTENLQTEIESAYVAQQAAIHAQDPSGGEARGAFYASILRRGEESLSTWTPGVATLLPKVDYVAINLRFPNTGARDHALRAAVGGREEPIVVPWDEFVAICGTNLRMREDLYPRRWWTQRYPTEEEIRQFLEVSSDSPPNVRPTRPASPPPRSHHDRRRPVGPGLVEDRSFVDAMIPRRQTGPVFVVALVAAVIVVGYLLRTILRL